LGQVAYHFRSGCDLDDIAKEIIGLLVGLLGLRPLRTETLLRGLEDQVGQLATRNLVLIDFGVGSGKTGLEGRVNQTDLGPVADELLVGFKERTWRITCLSMARRWCALRPVSNSLPSKDAVMAPMDG
jgi:hypothetical protein